MMPERLVASTDVVGGLRPEVAARLGLPPGTPVVAGGVDAVRIGVGPTPMLYYAEATLGVDGGIQVTGSHNPAGHNGFKLMLRHRSFFGDDVQDLARLLAKMGADIRGIGSNVLIVDGRRELGGAGPRRSLDQLAQRPGRDVQLGGPLGRLHGRRERWELLEQLERGVERALRRTPAALLLRSREFGHAALHDTEPRF